jgi:methylated-DNA-protein-cysteine methyltransferase-like protein
MGNTYERTYSIIKQIPRGRVATYGQIAQLAGLPGHARQVGYALNALTDGHDVPWHRVINSKGGISKRSEPHFENIQRDLLEREGVVFGENARISLTRYQWKPERSRDKEEARPRADYSRRGRRSY